MPDINKNRSFQVTIKKAITDRNGVTTITTQTNKQIGNTIIPVTKNTVTSTNQTQEAGSLISNLTTQVNQLTTSSLKTVSLFESSYNILTGTLNTLSSSFALLSSSTNNNNQTNTIITLPSSLSSSKSVFYKELTSSINVGEELKFNLADFSTVNFKNNVSVFVNGVRLITDEEINNPEVFPVSGSKDTVKFNVQVPDKSLVTMEVFGSIFI